MHLWQYVVLGVTGFLIVCVVRWLRALKSHSVDVALKLVGDQKVLEIETFANFFGLESEGPTGARGAGCLVGTARDVALVVWTPRRELVIPRAMISKVEAADEHLGKSVKRKLLKITFRNAAGQQDSAAWWVTDLKGWLALLSGPTH